MLEGNNVQKDFPMGVRVTFLVGTDTTVSVVKTVFVFRLLSPGISGFRQGIHN